MAFACLQPDTYWWICGPTYRLGEKEFRVIHDIFVRKLKLGPQLKISNNVNQGIMKITFPWNSVVEVVSATNPDSLLGEGLDGVIMSEAAQHNMDTWQQYIQPALTDRKGWAIFPSTPKGYNWYYGLWRLGRDKEMRGLYESWRFPTWLNSARFPLGLDDPELQNVKKLASPQYWAQEYCAEFTTFEGQIYDEFDERIHVTDIEYISGWKNYWVFDYGFNAPFVCLDIMVDPSDNVYVWREYQMRFLTTWDHAHILKSRDNPEDFHVDAMYGDPAGADEAATIALVLGYVISEKVPWINGIEAVKRKLKIQPDGKPQLYIDRSCSELIRQMLALRRPAEKEGRPVKEGQVDYDDHGPDALRYFIGDYFILGLGSRLDDVYDSAVLAREADTFFRLEKSITLGSDVGFYGDN